MTLDGLIDIGGGHSIKYVSYKDDDMFDIQQKYGITVNVGHNNASGEGLVETWTRKQ